MKAKMTFVAVLYFAFGVLVRDVAQDFSVTSKECQRAMENAERYAGIIVDLLNEGGRVTAPGAVVSCKVRHTE